MGMPGPTVLRRPLGGYEAAGHTWPILEAQGGIGLNGKSTMLFFKEAA